MMSDRTSEIDRYGLRKVRAPELVPDFVVACAQRGEGIAAFDADGTLWTNDVADDFTQWMIGRGRLDGDRWSTYMRIYRDDPPAGCQYLLSLYAGVDRDALVKEVEGYWRDHAARAWIWPVIEAIHVLRGRLPIWIVSGTPTEFLRPLERILGVQRVIGMGFQIDERGRITGEVEGIPCAGEGKRKKLQALIGDGEIAICAGNGSLDAPMMELAKQAWSVYPNAEFATYSAERGWPILPRPADFVEEEKFLL